MQHKVDRVFKRVKICNIFQCLRIIILLIIIVSLNHVDCQNTSEKDLTNTVLEFLQQNGMKYVTFITLDVEEADVKAEFDSLVRTSKVESNLRSTVLQPQHFDSKYRFHQDTLVLVTSSTSRNWRNYIEIITSTKIMSCVVICIGQLPNEKLQEVTQSLIKQSENAYFYWLGIKFGKPNSMDWKQIISVKNNKKIIATPIEFDSFGRAVLTKNLNGMHINCTNLDWSPWFKFSDCKGPNTTNCSGVGYLADVMNIFGARFNFTWSCDKEPEGNWGNIRPILGPRNASGSWGGIFGLVINGTYQTSINAWRYFDWRKGLFDFATFGSVTKNLVAYIPSGSSYDPELYFRPFTHVSWTVIVLIWILIFLVLFTGRRFEQRVGRTRGANLKLIGIKLVGIVGSIYILLIFNGFYKGSLTKFFTKETVADFESESDVMNAYPTWTYNTRVGSEVYVLNRAESGDKDYQRYAPLMEADPEKFMFKTVEEGIGRIKSGKFAILELEKALQEYYKENPFDIRPNLIQSHKSHVRDNMIFTKNSPLNPLFAAGHLQLLDSGITEILEETWMGKELIKEQPQSLVTTVLNLGQTMVTFIILAAAIILSISILLIEIVWNWISNEVAIII